jgi:hypothetical protein
MTASATSRDHGGSFAMAAASVGGVPLGPGTALVDEDVLRLLLLDSPTGEKALQFRYESIATVAMGDGSVVVSLRDSRQLVATTNEAAALRAALLGACRALPEVTRALRAFGSRRSIGGRRLRSPDKEARFFAPLIAARRAAMDARDAASVIASFEARRLAAQLSATIAVFAAEQSGGHPARRRALEAELGDAVEPLSVALTALEELAIHGAVDVDDLGRWRSWATGVQSVFEAADRSWIVIEPIVSR